MSGQQIGSVVGGVIGAYFGGPYGYAIGSAIGGAIGGYVDPTVIKGPKLTDATQQTASDGVPIPWGHGTFPTSGNIIWRSTLRERKKEDDGKGTGMVNVTYHYYRDFAIGICSGVRQADGTYLPIEGILQVTQNGKVVYDVQPGVSTEQAAQNTKFMRGTRFYLGSETQDPDSVIESHKGVGNAPAYPGMVYMVRENEEQPGGEIPQYGFVVSVCGTTTAGTGDHTEWLALFHKSSTGRTWTKRSPDGIDWSSAAVERFDFSVGTHLSATRSGSTIALASGPTFLTTDFFETTTQLSIGAGSDSVKLGGSWYSTNTAGVEGIQIWDGVTATDTGVSAETITSDGANIYAFDSGGKLRVLDAACAQLGCAWPAHAGYKLGPKLYFADGTVVLCSYGFDNVPVVESSNGSYGSCSIQEATLTNHSCPLPAISGSVKEVFAYYSEELATWFVAGETRLCHGASLDGLGLDAHVFPGRIESIHDDGLKVVVCGSYGTDSPFMEYSYDLVTWNSVTLSDAATIGSAYLVLAEGTVGDQIPDAPGYYIEDGQIVGPSADELDRCKPTLGEIVLDVCLRSGLSEDDVDVSQLTDEVDGFKVATETTAEAIIAPLMAGWFVDAAEFDDKIRFIKRGGDVVGELTYDDLCESDGDVIEETELQEAELLQKVNVRTIDPAAGFTVTTQTAERRTSTVLAKGEQTTEIPVVTDKDTQARMADKKLKVGWSETRRFKTCIPYTLPQYTPTDNIGLTDNRGRRQRVRLMEMAEDSGRIEIREAMLSRQSSYTSDVEGVTHAPPTDTSPGIIGPTYGWAGNLPSLRTSDNVPGAYLAACGYLRGWGGCAVLLSADDGVSYQEVTRFYEPSSMGVLNESCTASSEPLRVYMNAGTLSSITDAQLALRQNAFAITTGGTSELGQFRDAVIDVNEIYDLTNNVRGGLGTTAASHLAGDPFVMVASSKFLQLDISLAGRTLYFKFVSFGTSADDTTPYPFVFNPLFTSVVVDAYADENGEHYADEDGNTYYSETST